MEDGHGGTPIAHLLMNDALDLEVVEKCFDVFRQYDASFVDSYVESSGGFNSLWEQSRSGEHFEEVDKDDVISDALEKKDSMLEAAMRGGFLEQDFSSEQALSNGQKHKHPSMGRTSTLDNIEVKEEEEETDDSSSEDDDDVHTAPLPPSVPHPELQDDTLSNNDDDVHTAPLPPSVPHPDMQGDTLSKDQQFFNEKRKQKKEEERNEAIQKEKEYNAMSSEEQQQMLEKEKEEKEHQEQQNKHLKVLGKSFGAKKGKGKGKGRGKGRGRGKSRGKKGKKGKGIDIKPKEPPKKDVQGEAGSSSEDESSLPLPAPPSETHPDLQDNAGSEDENSLPLPTPPSETHPDLHSDAGSSSEDEDSLPLPKPPSETHPDHLDGAGLSSEDEDNLPLPAPPSETHPDLHSDAGSSSEDEEDVEHHTFSPPPPPYMLPNEAETESKTELLPLVSSPSHVRCDTGHPVNLTVVDYPWGCDRCGAEFEAYVKAHLCTKGCDYCVCDNCCLDACGEQPFIDPEGRQLDAEIDTTEYIASRRMSQSLVF